MAKTVFSDGDASIGLLGSIISAAYFNKLNNQRHTGRDMDGEGALDYASTGGSSDAYTLTLTPALDAYITGMPFYFKASFTNTGAATLNINSLGTKALKKNISDDVIAGDIIQGRLYMGIYDGTNIIVINPPTTTSASPIRDQHRNLIIKNNATYPNYRVDVSADEVILQDSSGASLRISSLSVTADVTSSGAGGLDTGSETVSTWYHLWAVSKADGTKSVIFSASSTSPTLPSGYTYKAYLGAIYNNASSNFISMAQYGKTAYTTLTLVGSSLTATSYTSLSLSSIVPSTARIARMSAYTSGSYVSHGYGLLAMDSSGLGETILLGWGDANSNDGNAGTGEFGILNQTVYYKVTTFNLAYLYCSGWSFE